MTTRRNPDSAPLRSEFARRRAGRVPSAVVRGSLEDGLTVCLGLLASDPERFEPAAVAWYTRWCAFQPGLRFSEARRVLAALDALAGANAPAAARALGASCRQHGLDEVAAVLDTWLELRAAAETTDARSDAGEGHRRAAA
jgi:hypothetical protein